MSKVKSVGEFSDRANLAICNQVKIWQALNLVDSVVIPVEEDLGISSEVMLSLKSQLTDVFRRIGVVITEEIPGDGK